MIGEEVTDSQPGHQDNIDDNNSAYKSYHASKTGAIFLQKDHGNVTFQVTSMSLYLLKMKEHYRGLDHEYPHQHVRNFIEICSPF